MTNGESPTSAILFGGAQRIAIEVRQALSNVDNALLLKTQPTYIQHLSRLIADITQAEDGLAISLRDHNCVVISGKLTDEDIDEILRYLSDKLPEEIELHVQKQTKEADLILHCPIKIGKIVQIVPENLLSAPHKNDLKEDNCLSLILKTGDSFGQGNHPTTKGCIHALEWLFENNLIQAKTALDCGTGSGILAICSCLMGAKEVLGIDVNETAIHEAEINRDLNNLSPERFRLMLGSASTITPERFDIILMNVTPSIREMLLKSYQKKLRAGSIVIISGQKGTKNNGLQICQAYPTLQHIQTINISGWDTYIFR